MLQIGKQLAFDQIGLLTKLLLNLSMPSKDSWDAAMTKRKISLLNNVQLFVASHSSILCVNKFGESFTGFLILSK